MRAWFGLLGVAVLGLWTGSADAQPADPQLTSNDFSFSTPAQLDQALPADGYYARIIINSAFDSEAVSEIDRKSRSRWRRLSRSQKKGVAVIPIFEFTGTVAGRTDFTLPSVPLLSLGVDTDIPPSADAPWNKRTVTQFQSPWFSLGTNSSFKIRLEERSLEDNQWRLFQNVLPTLTQAAGGFFSIPIGQRQASGIDGIINFFAGSAAPGSVASSNELRFDPLGTGEYAYSVEYYDLNSRVQKRFGYSEIRVQFKQSHRSTQIIQNGRIADRTARINPTPRFSSIRLLPPMSPERTLQSLPIYNSIRDAVGNGNMNVADFTDRCNTFRSEFKTEAGLTDLDANIALLEALNDAGWSNRARLLRSNCFDRFAREQLASFGFGIPQPIDTGGRLRFTGRQRSLMGRFLRVGILPDEEAEIARLDLVSALFAEDVELNIPDIAFEDLSGLSSSFIDPDGLLDDLRGMSLDRYCCWSTPRKTNPVTGRDAPDRSALRMIGLLAPDPQFTGRQDHNLIAIEFATTSESAEQIGRVSIVAPTERELGIANRRLCQADDRPAYLECE